MTTSFISRLSTSPEESIKAPCVASSASNLVLSGEQTIDGVAVVAGDRVLVRSQTDSTENGVYDASASAWTRSTDFNDPSDLINGNLVPDANSVNDILYQVQFTGDYEPGVTLITFRETVSSGLITYTGATGIQEEYYNRGQYHVNYLDDLIGVDLTSFVVGETVNVNLINAASIGTSSTWKKVADSTTPPDAASGINSDGFWYSAAVSPATKFEKVLINFAETVSELKTFYLPIGVSVTTQGYYSAGDGGGATYLIVAPQAFDGYGDHQLANLNIAVLQVVGEVNVKQYGAKGDAANNDTSPVQAADNFSKSLPYNSNVYFPGGNYMVSGLSHENGPKYVGDGSGISTITHIDGNAGKMIHITGGDTGINASPYYGFVGLSFKAGDSTDDLIYYDGRIDNNVQWDDLQFLGNASAVNVNAINVGDYLNFHIGTIRFDGIGGWGVKVRDASLFSHAVINIDDATYDNGTGFVSNGQGMLYIDCSSLSVSKGVVIIKKLRGEVNSPMTSTLPSRSIFRFLQNHSRLDTSEPQIHLHLEDTTFDVAAVSDNMNIVSCDYKDISLSCDNVTLVGARSFYNNDNGDAKGAIYPRSSASFTKINAVPVIDAFNQGTVLGKDMFGPIARSYCSSESTLDAGFFKRGDVSYRLIPTNTAGNIGRIYASKAGQEFDGDGSATASTGIGATGSITAASAVLTLSTFPDGVTIGKALRVPGAGVAAADLISKVISIDPTAKTATLDDAASTTVSGVTVYYGDALMFHVDMVRYGTIKPTTGAADGDKVGDKVINANPAETGSATSKYIVVGWIFTSGGWFDMRTLTGN